MNRAITEIFVILHGARGANLIRILAVGLLLFGLRLVMQALQP
jgi:hypothetical protein